MKYRRVSGGAVAGSIIIAVVMTIVLFCTTTALIVNRIFTEKFIATTIGSIKEIEIPITVDGKEYDNISDAVSGVISESINEATGGESLEESEISEEEINEFIEESGIEDLLAEKLGVGMEAILNGEDVSILTEDDIMDFVEDNEDIIEDTFEVDITEEMKDELRTEIKNADIEDTFTTGTITQYIYEEETNPLAPLLKTVRTMFTTQMVIAGYVVVVAMWVGIFFLNKRQIGHAGLYLGIPATIVGVGVASTSLMVKGLSSLAAEELGGFVKPEMFAALNELLLNIGVIYIVVRVVFIVVSAVLKSAAKRNAALEQNSQEVA